MKRTIVRGYCQSAYSRRQALYTLSALSAPFNSNLNVHKDVETHHLVKTHLNRPLFHGSHVRSFSSHSPYSITASDVLRRKGLRGSHYHVDANASISHAIALLVERRIGSLIVVEDEMVVGMVTARDLLRAINRAANQEHALDTELKMFMTPASRIVHVQPEDDLELCSKIMSELKVRTLPILDKGKLYGVVTLKDVMDLLNERQVGGKSNYVRNILSRRGISSGTVLIDADEEAARVGGGLAERLWLETGAASYPAPGKMESEDAYFVSHLRWPHAYGEDVSYFGVADGVGSWRSFGIDPTEYSQRLVACLNQAIHAAAGKSEHPPSPLDLLTEAWKTVTREHVIGSATICVANLEHSHNQISVANVGDSGMILIRETHLDRVGSLLRGGIPTGLHEGLRVGFRSTQQLHSFNQPYQLGYLPPSPEQSSDKDDIDNHSQLQLEEILDKWPDVHNLDSCTSLARFETPRDADTLRFPVIPGDILIMATDGLFDNVDEVEILTIVQQWLDEQKKNGVEPSREPCDSDDLTDLAHRLADRAYELSMDTERDSPFAILAKENDILWSQGGRMDDISVVCARIHGDVEHDV